MNPKLFVSFCCNAIVQALDKYSIYYQVMRNKLDLLWWRIGEKIYSFRERIAINGSWIRGLQWPNKEEQGKEEDVP